MNIQTSNTVNITTNILFTSVVIFYTNEEIALQFGMI